MKKKIIIALILVCTVIFSACSTDTSEKQKKEKSSTAHASECKYANGTHSATVEYSNSETGFSANYTLDVEVRDCQVVQINFPNNGYLDESHITAAELDEDGNASVEGENGKAYEIKIEN